MQMTTKMQTEQKVVSVERPFVLFIKDDSAETVVFAAKVDNPLGAAAGGVAGEPQARALVGPEPTPLGKPTITIYPPNFFPSSLNETMTMLNKLNVSARGLEAASGASDKDTVIMRIPPKEPTKKTSQGN